MENSEETKTLIRTYLEKKDFGRNVISSEPCIVCFSEVRKARYKTSCGHTFCKNCIFDWLMNHSKCPICRHRLYDDENLIHTFRAQLIDSMEDSLRLLSILNREDETTSILDYDPVLNYLLDKQRAFFAEFHIQGTSYLDVLTDFEVGTVITTDGETHTVITLITTSPTAFRFLTENAEGKEYSWKINLERLVLVESEDAETLTITFGNVKFVLSETIQYELVEEEEEEETDDETI